MAIRKTLGMKDISVLEAGSAAKAGENVESRITQENHSE